MCLVNKRIFLDSSNSSMWLGGLAVAGRVLDLRSIGRGFEFQPPRCRVQSGKLLTHVPLSPSSIIWYQQMGGDALQLGR